MAASRGGSSCCGVATTEIAAAAEARRREAVRAATPSPSGGSCSGAQNVQATAAVTASDGEGWLRRRLSTAASRGGSSCCGVATTETAAAAEARRREAVRAATPSPSGGSCRGAQNVEATAAVTASDGEGWLRRRLSTAASRGGSSCSAAVTTETAAAVEARWRGGSLGGELDPATLFLRITPRRHQRSWGRGDRPRRLLGPDGGVMGPRRVTLSGNSCCGAHWVEATAAVTADDEAGLPRFQGASGDAVLDANRASDPDSHQHSTSHYRRPSLHSRFPLVPS